MRLSSTLAAAACLAVLLAPAPAPAARLPGTEFPDAVTVGGRACRLNGVGVRTKLVVKVYLGALYLATPTGDAAAAVAAEEPKRVALRFLRSVDAAKIREAFDDGFRKAPGGGDAALRERVDRFLSWMDGDLATGDELVFTYLPGRGTEVSARGAARGTVEGADFMRALWSVWLGPSPADAGLKKGMLGR